ncbi:MAG: SCO family protein [Nitrospirae bacterium]|nr:SCO family protein [Nitrospirota bacterium]
MTARGPFAFTISLMLLVVPCLAKEVRAYTRNEYKRTVENYQVPEVTLVNQDGRRVKLGMLLNSKKPVMVDFVFTTCTTICPLLSANFSDLQKKLGPESGKVQLISLSIDPENDTPKAMKAYLQRYNARPGWDFLTGSREDISRVIKAFEAYTPNKMSHLPLILLKSPSDTQWIRIFGLVSSGELMREYQRVIK